MNTDETPTPGPWPDTTERDHLSPAAGPWIQRHVVEVVSDDGRFGFAAQVGICRTGVGSGLQATFACAVLEADRRPIAIVQDGIEAPARLWEFRASGLWVEAVCETPWTHWSYGLEAFALALDDPAELLDRGYGDRVALGWEFEFHAEGGPTPIDVASGAPERSGSDGGYRQPGRSEGLLMFDSGPVEFTGTATRTHTWGAPWATSSPSAIAGGTADVALPGPVDVWWVGRSDEGPLTTRFDPNG